MSSVRHLQQTQACHGWNDPGSDEGMLEPLEHSTSRREGGDTDILDLPLVDKTHSALTEVGGAVDADKLKR
jgi:hypothetical protein